MPKLNGRVPAYRLHRRSGQAVVTLAGKDYYLGTYGTEASRLAYDRTVAEWLGRGRQSTHPSPRIDEPSLAMSSEPLTVNRVLLSYWAHVETYYRHPDGRPTTEVDNIRQALRPLRHLYGKTLATQFGPKALEAVRQHMIEMDWCRTNINKQVHRIGAVFRWAASKEMLPVTIYQQLKTVSPLKRGRTLAREMPRVKPVPEHLISPLQSVVSKQVWAMIQLQILTGARSEDLVRLRAVDLKTGQKIWTAEIAEHKTSFREHRRVLYFGPKAQDVLRPFLQNRPVDKYLFSPAEAETQRRADVHAARTTPLSCGNRPGTNRHPKPKRYPRDRYSVGSYRRAIERGCDQAFPPAPELFRQKVKAGKRKRWETDAEWKARLGGTDWATLVAFRKARRWHPHQLRHNAATAVRKEFGVEMARVVLGVRSISMAELYGERDEALAMEVVSKIG
jgi:integrase